MNILQLQTSFDLMRQYKENVFTIVPKPNMWRTVKPRWQEIKVNPHFTNLYSGIILNFGQLASLISQISVVPVGSPKPGPGLYPWFWFSRSIYQRYVTAFPLKKTQAQSPLSSTFNNWSIDMCETYTWPSIWWGKTFQ